jgi:hypothetical protein
MSYRIYLLTADGGKFEKSETGSRSIAQAVFKAFLERDELDGKPVSLHLVHMRTTLAVHRFDVAAGGAENWQGREDEIPWPEGTGQVGRPAELEGGMRKNVYLDAASIAKARKLGKGNFSLGLRIALSRV